jgi:hypothetical protein
MVRTLFGIDGQQLDIKLLQNMNEEYDTDHTKKVIGIFFGSVLSFVINPKVLFTIGWTVFTVTVSERASERESNVKSIPQGPYFLGPFF